MRRFGWLMGVLCWHTCRQRGCDWWIIPHSQHRIVAHYMPDGVWYSRGTIKARCECCESVRLLRLEVWAWPNGAVKIFSPDGNIVLKH